MKDLAMEKVLAAAAAAKAAKNAVVSCFGGGTTAAPAEPTQASAPKPSTQANDILAMIRNRQKNS